MLTQETLPKQKKARKRVGRWNASWSGTYCGRGMNGQNARSGGWVSARFEWGQSPMHIRLPKLKGFNKTNWKVYTAVNLSDITRMIEAWEKEITFETYKKHGLTSSKREFVKILGGGKVKACVPVHAHKASASAIKAMEKAGGTFTSL